MLLRESGTEKGLMKRDGDSFIRRNAKLCLKKRPAQEDKDTQV